MTSAEQIASARWAAARKPLHRRRGPDGRPPDGEPIERWHLKWAMDLRRERKARVRFWLEAQKDPTRDFWDRKFHLMCAEQAAHQSKIEVQRRANAWERRRHHWEGKCQACGIPASGWRAIAEHHLPFTCVRCVDLLSECT